MKLPRIARLSRSRPELEDAFASRVDLTKHALDSGRGLDRFAALARPYLIGSFPPEKHP